MATISKTKFGTWKAIIRKKGWPTTIKTFRTKRDAADWARRVEDEMVKPDRVADYFAWIAISSVGIGR